MSLSVYLKIDFFQELLIYYLDEKNENPNEIFVKQQLINVINIIMLALTVGLALGSFLYIFFAYVDSLSS